jgi:hypothetical protein
VRRPTSRPGDGVQQSSNRDPPALSFAAPTAEEEEAARARARSRMTREDVVSILMMIVVDVPVLGRSIRLGRWVEFDFSPVVLFLNVVEILNSCVEGFR